MMRMLGGASILEVSIDTLEHVSRIHFRVACSSVAADVPPRSNVFGPQVVLGHAVSN